MINFPHEIIYKNTRNAYARINRDGIVVFTIPKRLQKDEKFLTEFLQRWEKLYQRYSKKEKLQSTTDETLLIFWEQLSWSDFFDNNKSYSKSTKEKKLKEILLEYSKERVDKFSKELWVPYKSLTIRKMKARRWQCSSRQDIVLNLQLVHLPQKYIQYVAAHECAHLVQKNHSDKFWKVVESLYPKYKEVRKEMRKFILE
jgi:predicted metal-dependent hydrolase